MYASIASFDKIQQTLYYHRLPSRRPSTCWPSRLSTVPCRRKEWWKELWLSSQNRRNRMRNCGRLNEGYALRNRATDKKDACKNVDTVKSKRESWEDEENNFPPRVYHLLHETYRTFCCLRRSWMEKIPRKTLLKGPKTTRILRGWSLKVQLFGILSSTISNTFYALRVPSSETKFKLKSQVKTDKYNKIGKSNRRELRRDIFRLSPLHVDEVRGKRRCVRG